LPIQDNSLFFSFYWKIDELIREFPSVSVIEANEILSLPIHFNGHAHTLLISLPPATESTQPLLFCDPRIPNHSMIEADGRVLLAPDMGRDGDLVGIVKRILGELQQVALGAVDNSTVNNTTSFNINTTSFNNNTTNTTTTITSSFQLNQNDLNLLHSLTHEQCQTLLNANDQVFQKFLSNNMTSVQEQEKLNIQIESQIREKANANLSLRREIDQLASQLDQAHASYNETLQSYKNFMVLNSATLNELKPDCVFSKLQVSLMELNDLSSDSLKTLINDGCETKNFDLELKEAIKQRKEYHKKAILLQKFQEDQK
jgi:hypothetical protein